MSELTIRTTDGERTLFVTGPDLKRSVPTVAGRQGLAMNTRCGQAGACDGCAGRLVAGSLVRIADGSVINPDANSGTIKTCQYRLGDEPAVIELPDRSLLAYEPVVLSEFVLSVPFANDPLVPHSTDKATNQVGVAIDVGTTTVAVLVVDLSDGSILAKGSSFNRQMHMGDDVLARINLCMNDKSLVDRMQEAVVNETIAPLLDEALVEAGVTRDRVAAITVAGNTTMLHLFAAVDPSGMAVAPFTPDFIDHTIVPASTVDFRFPQDASSDPGDGAFDPQWHLLPGLSGYVGADISAGVVAGGLVYDDGPALLVDVGTNGEIIFKHGDVMLGCATAAGPAFEGSGLCHGVRAGNGAISRIDMQVDDDNALHITTETIGDAKPTGVCGSAYIDFLAKARRVGLIDEMGHFEIDRFANASELHAKGIECHGSAVHVAKKSGGDSIAITEGDVSLLVQAKAAIAAGVLTLLDRQAIAPADIKTVYLAGGFGMHMDTASAVGCGLLPKIKVEQVKLIGNSSLAGAYMALLDKTMLTEMQHLINRVEIVELNLDPRFEDHYLDQFLLPAT